MSNPGTKTFHDAVKPLVYFNCFNGMGAFRSPNQSRNEYLFMKLYTVIVNILHWTFMYITAISLTGIVDLDNISPFALTMYKILICANSCISVIAPFLVWFRKKLIGDCVRQFLIFDETYRDLLGAPNEYKKEYNRLICQIVAMTIVMLTVGICDCISRLQIELPELNTRSVLNIWIVGETMHHPILTMLLLDVNFCTFVRYFEKKFRDLNASLLRLEVEEPSISSPGKRLFMISQNLRKRTSGNEVKDMGVGSLITDKHSILRKHRKAHLKLCELSQKINHGFGIQNLLSTAVSFVMITGLLFNIYGAFTSENLASSKMEEVISPALWTAIYAFKIWMVNHTCWRVSNEAERTGQVVYELLNLRADKELQREIQEFGIQMLQNPVRFNACGFFTLDYTFVQGVIGSITTYLVILIQMSHLSPSSTSNTAIARNDTQISMNRV